jgi:hypothetical protein
MMSQERLQLAQLWLKRKESTWARGERANGASCEQALDEGFHATSVVGNHTTLTLGTRNGWRRGGLTIIAERAEMMAAPPLS